MSSPDALRERYAAGSLQTASPSKIVTMCFDRLDRDVAVALEAIEVSDHYGCNAALGHAQDLVAELAGMLDLEAWEHAGALVAVYDYLLRLLAVANTLKDAALVREAQRIVAELGDGFRRAADLPTAPVAGGGTATEPAPPDPDRPRLSIQA